MKPVANGGSTFSVLGADVTIKGNVEASADLHVDGTVEGDLVCTSLVQGESSRIEGGITADSARILAIDRQAIRTSANTGTYFCALREAVHCMSPIALER